MDDDQFKQWREAQLAVAEAERRLALASHPSTAGLVDVPRDVLEQQLRQAREAADAALALCLRETRRLKRTTRQLGIDSSGSDSGR